MQNTARPRPFVWGVATAAAQIEGAAHEDGKEDSIWDRFARIPGAVDNGDTPETADDHYHRMPADVALLKQLGIGAYRFSTSWARVKPGDLEVNPLGLDFYSRLVDELLGAGIDPWLTLYHWDLPQAVEDHSGGWVNRDTAFRFRDYTVDVYEALGDRVENWITLNEPFCASLLGYAEGIHAPGRINPRAGLAAVHHQLLAHGLGTLALRDLGATNVGITLNTMPISPADPDAPADVDAARRIDGLQNRLFLEPLLLGAYPADVLDDVREHGLEQYVAPGDLTIISQPVDFLGLNYYADQVVTGRGAPSANPQSTAWVGSEFVQHVPRDLPHTAMGWEVNPDGLRRLLTELTEGYPSLPPLYITENGSAYDDVVAEDGSVDDRERRRYLLEHIGAVQAAIAEGADVRGYFVWSLLDNFEWAEGYAKRFGIVHVDYETQQRTVKASGLAYSRVIAEAAG